MADGDILAIVGDHQALAPPGDVGIALVADIDALVAADVGAYSTGQVDALISAAAASVGKRARVRAATTANITVSTALNNGDTLDGVTLATGDLVLVKNQSAAAENGVYVVGTSPARSSEFDTYNEHPGSLIAVAEGTTNADTLWLCTSNDGGTLNSTAIAFSKLVIAGELLAANNLSDVASPSTALTNLGGATATDVANLTTLAAVQAAQIAARQRANQGYYVGAGIALSASGTPGKLQSTAGIIVAGPSDVALAANSAITGGNSSFDDITEMADATHPKLVIVEHDGTNFQYNGGTAATPPAVPDFTAARVPLYLMSIPAGATNATTIDSNLTGSPSNVKLIDLREFAGAPDTGWQYDSDTWVYVSATSFKIAGKNVTARFTKGTRVSWRDGTNAPGYGVVASSAFSTDTTVTLITTSDFSIANATITAPRFSYQASPQGFPDWFNYTPTVTGYSSVPTSTVYRWSATGRTCKVHVREGANGTSNATTVTISLPVAHATITNDTTSGRCSFVDNGTAHATLTGVLGIGSGNSVINACPGPLTTAVWTNANGKRVIFGEIEYPF